MPTSLYYTLSQLYTTVQLHTVQQDILAGMMFGGLLEKGRKLQLADTNLAVTGS